MKIIPTLLTALGLCLAPAGAPQAAEPAGTVIKQFTSGEYTVYPLLDRSGQMKIELFSGPLSPEERSTLMPGGQAPSSVNVFLITGPAGNILVDLGWGASGPGENHLPERLMLAGLSLDDIDLVLLTHMHPDHIGGLLNGRSPALAKARLKVARPELEYWTRQSRPATPPPPAEPEAQPEPETDESAPQPAPSASADQPEADAVQPVAAAELPGAVIAAYQGRIDVFDFDQEVAPGLTALKAVGHTPGHTAFLLKSGSGRLLFIGDLIHAAALQFPAPDECAAYDQDKPQAVTSRRELLAQAASEDLPVAGAHLPFPGLGRVKSDGRGGFAFTPIP